MTQSTLWPSMTGEIVRLEQRDGANAKYASLTIECKPNGEGQTWRRDAVAFDGVMEKLLELGVGARVFVRGPLRSVNRSTESGTPYKLTTMTVRQVEHKPAIVREDVAVETPAGLAVVADAAAMDAPIASNEPVLPEGATELTHQLYTKKDGSKAWRKRPVAKTVAVAEAEPVAEVAPVVAAPVVVSPVAKPAVTLMVATDDNGEETALGAALRKALMNA